ncbi:hypothetical protein GCM10008023_09460 [Sphingomonas glacialis]|uniref:Uncharacterized protein n=1 Tax=Sphingomonas glacialis TaxID=658225 RepID=A0ABQ3LBG1_9SPHN|nr:hypothetical protein GCM10008023_09460 [Sphingomonas glacialis]
MVHAGSTGVPATGATFAGGGGAATWADAVAATSSKGMAATRSVIKKSSLGRCRAVTPDRTLTLASYMRAPLTGKQLAKLRFAPGILPGPHRALAAPILVMLYRCLAQRSVRPCGGASKRAMLPQ